MTNPKGDLPHFENCMLKTNKRTDFLIFATIVKLLSENKHKTQQGLQEIINYRGGLNWGLPEKLEIAFPLTQPVSRALINKVAGKLPDNFSPEWLAGFCTGESNFFIVISNSSGKGTYTWLRFSIGQDSRDISLLEEVVKFWGCGRVDKYNNREVCEFVVTKIDDIVNIIIPFLDKYAILGSKHLNYIKFREAANIIKNKQHLTEEGFNRIK